MSPSARRAGCSRVGLRFIAALLALAVGQPHGRCGPGPATADVPQPEPGAVVEHEGETFKLARSARLGTAECEEYILAGETLEDWTQLVTVQRVALSTPPAPGDFVAQLQRRLRQQGAELDVLQAGAVAVAFAVRFSAAAEREEQVALGLAFVSATEPLTLTMVQYALKPLRSPLPLVEQRLRSWRATLARQASLLSHQP